MSEMGLEPTQISPYAPETYVSTIPPLRHIVLNFQIFVCGMADCLPITPYFRYLIEKRCPYHSDMFFCQKFIYLLSIINLYCQNLFYMIKYSSEMVWYSMKKFNALILLLIFLSISVNSVIAAERPQLGNIQSSSKLLTEEEFGFKKVRKHYTPYEIAVVNNNPVPVVVTANTSVEFISADGTVTPSDSRRKIYRTGKRFDHSKHWLGALPWTVPSNVRFARNMMIEKPLPIKFEPGKVYHIRVFSPINVTNPVAVSITNVTFDKKTLCDIKIPIESVEEL